uniref:Uncharacterized protein n=1 Tax=Romanomermis culicivorax TaxID=13658 RepID=A0A915JG07_ROMCU
MISALSSCRSVPSDKNLRKITDGIDQMKLFSRDECSEIEQCIDDVVLLGEEGFYRTKTVDRAPLRVKYFFGEGYTYGSQMDKKGPGAEKLYAKGVVDPIPEWIFRLIVKPMVKARILPSEDWIVSSSSLYACRKSTFILNSSSRVLKRMLARVAFAVCSRKEAMKLLHSDWLLSGYSPRAGLLERSINTPLELTCFQSIRILCFEMGYAADGITHCVRPEDVTSRRAVIILRRTRRDAPRLPLGSPNQLSLTSVPSLPSHSGYSSPLPISDDNLNSSNEEEKNTECHCKPFKSLNYQISVKSKAVAGRRVVLESDACIRIFREQR